MSDLQYLLLVLALLYLSECLYWVRRGSVVVRRFWRRGFEVAHPSPGLGGKRVGVVFVNPLPAFGAGFVVHAWPVSMTGEGVHAYVRQVLNLQERAEHLGGAVRWDDIWKIGRDGEVIYVNKKIFVRCNGEAMGMEVERVMRLVHGASGGKERRERVIGREMRRRMDVRRIGRERERYRLVAGGWSGLRWNAHLLFFLIFVAVPVTIGVPAYRSFLLMGLAMLAGMLLIQGVTFFQMHRRIFPVMKGARWKATLTMILTPTASVRACDMVGKEMLAGYEPAAVAMALCGKREKRGFLRRVLLDMRYAMRPVYWSEDSMAREVTDGFHEMMDGLVAGVVREGGMEVEELIGPPAREDVSCKSYCPRCDGMYVVEEGECEHCGGVGLRRFEEGVGVG